MIIELKNVNKAYGNKKVLQNFNLTVNEGEMIAVTGASGAGKTTLLNIIGFMEKCDSGDVTVCGYKNCFKNEREKVLLYRNNLGYLFQNFALIDETTVSKNLDLPLSYVKGDKNFKLRLKIESLERMGLSDKINSKIYELSGGEQQRVAMARLLLKKCNLILCDEPTGSLDKDNRKVIMNLLDKLNQSGKTVLIVTHDEFVTQVCHRNVCM